MRGIRSRCSRDYIALQKSQGEILTFLRQCTLWCAAGPDGFVRACKAGAGGASVGATKRDREAEMGRDVVVEAELVGFLDELAESSGQIGRAHV